MLKKTLPNPVKTTLQIHSQAKVEFYANYLKRYLRILNLSPHIERINIYDVFCGMGIYEDGGKGSPVIAFDAIKLLRIHEPSESEIHLIINDKEREKVEAVKAYIGEKNKGYCEVTDYNLDIETMFQIVKQQVSQSSRKTRNLIFIDPYGYKNIKKEMLYDLMANGKTEIILFLPISHMHRFTRKAVQDQETEQYRPLREFVYSYFEEDHIIRTQQVEVMEYINYIKEALKYGGNFYTTSYYIKRDASNYFALFFMSSHIYGFQKILEVKWELDTEAGRGFKLPKPHAGAGLFDEHFEEESKNKLAEVLKNILLKALESPITNKELYQIILRNEYLPKQAITVLKEIQESNSGFKVVNLQNGKPPKKGAFYIDWKYYKEEYPKVTFLLEKKNENN
ncbi:MAG: three-Cys-motif partner protein TcmP [Tannerellaceae bacterium]|nr:three-Cys-motif partner protein TcmP [Tannerellaceae bacterium]